MDVFLGHWNTWGDRHRAAIARLYNRNPADIIVVNHDTALAIKVSFPRPQSSGSKP